MKSDNLKKSDSIKKKKVCFSDSIFLMSELRFHNFHCYLTLLLYLVANLIVIFDNQIF